MRKKLQLERSELLIVVVALLYILSPIDVVPELVAGPLGLTDDLAAFALLGATVMRARRPVVPQAPLADSAAVPDGPDPARRSADGTRNDRP